MLTVAILADLPCDDCSQDWLWFANIKRQLKEVFRHLASVQYKL